MEILRCLLLPIYGKTLIVPYSALAEVITFPKTISYVESKSCVIGEFEWRGFTVPLLCLEAKDKEGSFKQTPNLHVAILNRMNEGNYPDFIGIVLQTVPVMNRYKRADMEFVRESKEPYLLMEVKVRDKMAFIPNITWIEETAQKKK